MAWFISANHSWRKGSLKKLSPAERKILNMIRMYGCLSRAQIAQYADISLTKIAHITDQLDKKDLVKKIEGTSSGGRRPSLLQVKDDICFTLGIEIGTQHLRAAVINTNGSIVGSTKLYEPLEEKRTISIQDLQELGNQALQSAHLSWADVAGIGLGITGIVDENSGTCLFLSRAPDWQNLQIVQKLQKETNIQHIFLTDSVRGMALSESRYGFCREISNFIIIDVGVGLGAGIVINKEILTGSRGVVGEFGHMYIGGNSEMCVCGNYGCLESIASGWAIVRKARKAIIGGVATSMHNYISPGQSLQISDIIHAAKDGDKLAINLIEEAANYLSIGISTLINLLNPQMIIIAGGLVEGAEKLLMRPLTNGIRTKTLPWLQEDIDVRNSELGEYSAARGSATLALDKTFDFLL
jgi:predicted NBD/HSP70 family sugar kinase